MKKTELINKATAFIHLNDPRYNLIKQGDIEKGAMFLVKFYQSLQEYKEVTKPAPLDWWIFHGEKLPLRSGWYETKNSALEKNTYYHGGGGLQNVWWKDEAFVEKVSDFIAYWRPVQ